MLVTDFIVPELKNGAPVMIQLKDGGCIWYPALHIGKHPVRDEHVVHDIHSNQIHACTKIKVADHETSKMIERIREVENNLIENTNNQNK